MTAYQGSLKEGGDEITSSQPTSSKDLENHTTALKK